MATFNETYNFRVVTAEQEIKKRNGLSLEQLEAMVTSGKTEKIVEGEKVMYRRKPIAAALQVPAILDGITDPLIIELVKNEVKDYIRAVVIDVYKEDEGLPAHDWETIKRWREETGRRTSDEPDYSDEDLAKAAAIFTAYWTHQSKPQVGELFAALCMKACAWGDVKKLCTPKGTTITEEMVTKYQKKFAEVAAGLKEDQPEEASILQFLADKLEKHAKERFVVVDAAAAW